MISPGTATLALSAAKGLIKLSTRLDQLMAEKAATKNPDLVPLPVLDGGPAAPQKCRSLKRYLKLTQRNTPDPLSSEERTRIEAIIQRFESNRDASASSRIANQLSGVFEQYLPEQAVNRVIDPNQQYLETLQEFFPAIDFTDPDNRLAACYIHAGKQEGNISYAGRVGLLVVDVLAEFGAENTNLFVRDAKLQSIVGDVLKRFSQPQLETFNEWSPLLRHTLSATLNGVLDARNSFQNDDPWLNAALDALVDARSEAEDGDDYLLGLLQGDGYRLLLSHGLKEASERLADEEASVLRQVAADVLKTAAPLVKANKKQFAAFFRDHWGDLLNGALKSIEKHGPALLDDQPELLKQTLQAVIKQLAATNGKEVFTNDTLVNIVDAAIGVVATNPELITEDIDDAWLQALISSVAKTAGSLKIRKTFSSDGLESIIKNAAGTFAAHPELIVEDHEVFQVVVGGILSKISNVDRLTAREIGDAAVSGTLAAIAENPALLKTRYPELIAGFAGNLSELVAGQSLNRIQARDIISAATQAMLSNPVLFNELGDKIFKSIVEAVIGVTKSNETALLAGTTQIRLINKLLNVFAGQGARLARENNLIQLTQKLIGTLSTALNRAQTELGRRLTVPDLPDLLGEIVATLARGELPAELADEERFETVFNKVILQINHQSVA